MSNKLFVGGLPYATTETELQETFAKAGQVASVAIITDKMSGRSKGFGFVEMSNEEEVKAAIDMFNNTDFGGRTIKVDLAQPRREN